MRENAGQCQTLPSVQKRTEAWWTDWVAERRAFLKAKGPGAPPK